MRRRHLLKPLPVYVHVILLSCYFLCIASINIYKFGWEHLLVLAVTMPVMLSIMMRNRKLLRDVLAKKPARHWWWYGAFFVGWYGLGYVLLYGVPNMFAEGLIDGSDASQKGWIHYTVDFLMFYVSFAWKGLGFACIEVLISVLRHQFYLRQMGRSEGRARRKNVRMRVWISHFMGNLTQSLLLALRTAKNPFMIMESSVVILAYGTRLMAAPGSLLVSLKQEVYYLDFLRKIYREDNIKMEFAEGLVEVRIIPFLLLSIYKNMYKHGDFQWGKEALLRIELRENYMYIHCTNRIASNALWMYGKGGSGLRQLERLLRDEFDDLARMAYRMENEIFYLNIEIPITYECKQENFSPT